MVAGAGSPATRVGEDETVIKKLVQRIGISGELSRLQPAIGHLQRVDIGHVLSVV